jgi:hypothetical protein
MLYETKVEGLIIIDKTVNSGDIRSRKPKGSLLGQVELSTPAW